MKQDSCRLLTADKIEGSFRSFLEETGNIFTVFDKQDSGCISYGVTSADRRWLVKHTKDPEAVCYMQNAEAFHREITHPRLPRLLNSIHTSGGFALVYEWANGEVLQTPEFPGIKGRNLPESPHFRFRQLPANKIIAAMSDIYEVHAYLESRGFVAVDFYDGSIIYDFDQDELHLCDFDHYHKGPFTLETDRLFGSTRFMAPEEFVKGSRIDNLTNVYTMGAAAFVFLADGGSRDLKDWKASEALHRIASRAASIERNARYESLGAFYRDWLQAASVN